jgi:hypothetical protein
MTSSALLIGMFCVAVIVLAAMVALAVILLNPKGRKPKAIQSTPPTIAKPKQAIWILYIGISLIIAIWTVWGALFFLVTVWFLRMDPKPHQREIPYPSDPDKNSAKGIYTWLLLSPFLTVPAMFIAAINLDWNSSPNQRVFAALIPLVFHLPLLLLLDSKRPFVYRHAQQAIFLVALRAGMASVALSIGTYPGEGAWLFLLGNGALWLFGSLWARGQAVHGESWWAQRKGDTILPLEVKPIDQPTMKDEREDALKSLNAEGNTARQKALNAFRTGTPETRKQAVLVLSQLGEVEKF